MTYDPKSNPRSLIDTEDVEPEETPEELRKKIADLGTVLELAEHPGWALLEETADVNLTDQMRYLESDLHVDPVGIADARGQMKVWRWVRSYRWRVQEQLRIANDTLDAMMAPEDEEMVDA